MKSITRNMYWMGTEAAEAQRHLNSLVSKREIVHG